MAGVRSFAKDCERQLIRCTKRQLNAAIYPNSTSLGGDTTIGEGSTIGANVTLVITLEAGIQILDKNGKKPKKEVGEFSL